MQRFKKNLLKSFAKQWRNRNMNELVIVGVSAVIATILPLTIYKLIMSYIDTRSKKIKYYNEQYKKMEE